MSRRDSYKLRDLERVGVPKMRLHPRPPTTAEDRSSYVVFPDKMEHTDRRRRWNKPPNLMDSNNSTSGTSVDKLYRGSLMSEVIDHVFIGKIEAAYSEQLLCKLGIECIIDLTDLLPHQVPGKIKSLCPCTCALQTPHSRAKLRIGMCPLIFFRPLDQSPLRCRVIDHQINCIKAPTAGRFRFGP